MIAHASTSAAHPPNAAPVEHDFEPTRDGAAIPAPLNLVRGLEVEPAAPDWCGYCGSLSCDCHAIKFGLVR